MENVENLKDLSEPIELYIRNHKHHININREDLCEVFKTYGLKKLAGIGFSIYFEEEVNSYETSFFSTDGKKRV